MDATFHPIRRDGPESIELPLGGLWQVIHSQKIGPLPWTNEDFTMRLMHHSCLGCMQHKGTVIRMDSQ